MESQGKNPKQKEDLEDRLASSAGTVAIGTFSSRILGFIRDMILASAFGTSSVADAFYVAFRIPNFLRELFAEGSMSAAFVPVFSEHLTLKGKEEAKKLARATFTILLLITTAVVIIGIGFSPQILSIVARGFLNDPDKFHLTTLLTRMMFPFLLFISCSALTMGVLNSLHRFGPPAFSSAVYNLVNIATLLLLSPYFQEPVFAAAIGVTLGGLAQFLMQLPALQREGFSIRPMKPLLPLHPGVIKMGHLILPTVVGLSVTQVNLLVNTFLASFLPLGSVSYLYYGMRLIHFPLGIFAVALSTALLPTLSMQAAKKDFPALGQSFSFGLRFVFFITFPALMGLILFRVPIVKTLFERGAFDHLATLGTADALFFYALGLWAFAGIRIVVPVFYAMQDTKTPVKIGILTMLLNVVLSLLLMGPMQHRGLAFATSLAAIFNFLSLLFVLKQKIHWADGKRIMRSHIKVVISSLIMLMPAYWISEQIDWQTGNSSWAIKTGLLAAAITLSAFGYFVLQYLLKSEELRFLNRMIQKRLKR
ncbi:Proposed peptidoglycan lipid II flippase MurJ [hydrothermal vent metagenome]|uniref:Proposed peptidoglycan lipid II flippase MurJ n=1 Tax=hydrothermal vent metagenome TaxID=652676 RepID=A0A3B1CHS8_9ZZZZ